MSSQIVDISWSVYLAIEYLSEAESELDGYDWDGWDSSHELSLIGGIKQRLELFQKKPELLFDPTEQDLLQDISKRLRAFRSTDKFAYTADYNTTFVNAVASVDEIIQSVSFASDKIELIERSDIFTPSNILLLNNAVSELVLKLNKNPNEWHLLVAA